MKGFRWRTFSALLLLAAGFGPANFPVGADAILVSAGFAHVGGENERLSAFLREGSPSSPSQQHASAERCAGWCAASNCSAFSYQQDPRTRRTSCRIGTNATAREPAEGSRTYLRMSSNPVNVNVTPAGYSFKYPTTSGAYRNFLDLWWCFRSGAGTTITARSGGGWMIEETYDYVEIYDGCSWSSMDLLGVFKYPVRAVSVSSTANRMRVHFHTDESNELAPKVYTGFSLNLTTAP